MWASRWRKAWSHAPLGANELVDDVVAAVGTREGEHGAVWRRCPAAQICCSQESRMALESSQLEELRTAVAPAANGELQVLTLAAEAAASVRRPRCLGATKAPLATARSKASRSMAELLHP